MMWWIGKVNGGRRVVLRLLLAEDEIRYVTCDVGLCELLFCAWSVAGRGLRWEFGVVRSEGESGWIKIKREGLFHVVYGGCRGRKTSSSRGMLPFFYLSSSIHGFTDTPCGGLVWLSRFLILLFLLSARLLLPHREPRPPAYTRPRYQQ